MQNEIVANEESMAKKIKKSNNQHPTKSNNTKTPKWKLYQNWKRNM